MIGVSAEGYNRKIGNNENATIAGTVMVPWAVTNVLHNVCLPDH